MTIRKKAITAITLAAATLPMTSANAQVAGIATADTVQAIVQAKAFGLAYRQIGTTYQTYSQQIQTKSQEVNSLNAKLDTNGDKVLDQAEVDAAVKAKNPVLQQIDQKNLEIQQLQLPIAKAQIFAIEAIAKQYDAAQSAVVKAKKINVILAPDAFLYAPKAVDVTPSIVAELDKLLPTVPTTPPAEWKPSRQGAAIHKQIQTILGQAARIQAAQAAQQKAQAQPAAQPSSR